VAAIGVFCTFALFWTLPTAWLTGAAAAGGIAMINSIGNLAGFLSPYAVGWLKQATAANDSGMYMLAAFMILGGLLAISVPAKMVNK
jgi:nitrate/nitrite transporter NarK